MAQNGDPAPGFVTTQDEFAISWTESEACEKVELFLATKSEVEARSIFTLCSQNQWNYGRAKAALADGSWCEQVVKVLYRPFDFRWTVWNQNVAVHRRERVMRHMLGRKNIGLICTRQTKDQWGVLATRNVAAHKTCGAYDINFLFPLYLLTESSELSFGHAKEGTNLSPLIIRQLADALRLEIDRRTGLPAGLTPEDIFHYTYAVFHSPGYRTRYSEFLKIDFPRLPLTTSLELFHALAQLGGELTALHLLESSKLAQPITEFVGNLRPEVEKVSWSRDTVWVDRAQTTGFRGVREDVWKFHVGGYQVCEKWLKDRKRRLLSPEDICHYHRIVIALAETIRLMREIEETIAAHGGWPAAFATSKVEPASKGISPEPPLLERVALTEPRAYWLEFLAAFANLAGDGLTLPLLWEAHLVALEPSKYEAELQLILGRHTATWLKALGTEPIRQGIFREVLETLASNQLLTRQSRNGCVYLTVAAEALPVTPGLWRTYDATIIFSMISARSNAFSIENFKTQPETGYEILEQLFA